MITCDKCGFSNPLGTGWCRKCGEKITVRYADIDRSVKTINLEQRDKSILRSGRSALAMGTFLLACALVLRYVASPNMPPAELPPIPVADLLPPERPAWKPVEAKAPTQDAALVVATGRLAWRRTNAATLLNAVGVAPATVQAAQKLAGTVQEDGSVEAPDRTAATALAALALQACPLDDQALSDAARAREWLLKQGRALASASPQGRVLASLAIIDADDDGNAAGLTSELSVYLIDGKAAKWQALLQLQLPERLRSTQLAAVRAQLPLPPWSTLLELASGKRPVLRLRPEADQPDEREVAIETAAYDLAAGRALTNSEDRLAWALIGWQFHPSGKDLAEALKGWASASPAAVAPDLAKGCPGAAAAVQALVLSAPLRLPPLALQH